MDHSAASARVFDRYAARYRDKYLELGLYDPGYAQFCAALPEGAQVLDAACGPGNVARYLIGRRTDLRVLGIDLAPAMIALARAAVPGAEFRVHDARALAALDRRFVGIACAFGLPYFTPAEVAGFIASARACLNPGGVLYFSLLTRGDAGAEVQHTEDGEPVYVYYHREAELAAALARAGFALCWQQHLDSPANAPVATRDWVVIARREGAPRA